jgi:hypothetical protein
MVEGASGRDQRAVGTQTGLKYKRGQCRARIQSSIYLSTLSLTPLTRFTRNHPNTPTFSTQLCIYCRNSKPIPQIRFETGALTTSHRYECGSSHALLCGHVTQVLDIVRTHQYRPKSVVCGACNRASFGLRPSVKGFSSGRNERRHAGKVQGRQTSEPRSSPASSRCVPVLAHPCSTSERARFHSPIGGTAGSRRAEQQNWHRHY